MCERRERKRETHTNTQHSRTHVVVRVDEGTGWVSEGVRRVRRRERLEHVREPSLSPPSPPPPPPGYGMHACAVAKLQRQQPPQNAPKRLSLAHGSRQPPLNRVVLYTTTGPSSSSSPSESSSPESIPPPSLLLVLHPSPLLPGAWFSRALRLLSLPLTSAKHCTLCVCPRCLPSVSTHSTPHPCSTVWLTFAGPEDEHFHRHRV